MHSAPSEATVSRQSYFNEIKRADAGGRRERGREGRLKNFHPGDAVVGVRPSVQSRGPLHWRKEGRKEGRTADSSAGGRDGD